jgi:hypothetical protein
MLNYHKGHCTHNIFTIFNLIWKGYKDTYSKVTLILRKDLETTIMENLTLNCALFLDEFP